MIEIYPEMNRQIVDVLRVYSSPTALYAAARIEELESQLKKMEIQRNLARNGRTEQSERARFLSVELAQVREKIQLEQLETCAWKYDGQDCWETGCDNMFYFTAGGPKEDGFNFCPYCSLSIVIGEPHYSDEAWEAIQKGSRVRCY